jgi:hypothetical protein
MAGEKNYNGVENYFGRGLRCIILGTKALMTPAPTNEITRLLRAWGGGDAEALDRLAPVVFDELRRMSRRYMRRERAGHTLQTTALVNEVYLRLVSVTGLDWKDRAHFLRCRHK